MAPDMLDTSINSSEHSHACAEHLHGDDDIDFDKLTDEEKKAQQKKLAHKKERAETKKKFLED
jgi:hypothetical protein